MRWFIPTRGRFVGQVAAVAVATALQAALAVALLPLATQVLGAADFGIYALLMSVVAFACALADGGGALALPEHYDTADQSERRRMVATFMCVSLTLAFALAALLVTIWRLRGVLSLDLGTDLPIPIALACAALIPLRAVSAVATAVFSVSGRGLAIAGQIVAQALSTFVTTLIALFVLRFDVLALFVGALCGQLANVTAAAFALGSEPWGRPARRWLSVSLANAPTAAFAGIVDGIRTVAENALIARVSNLEAVAYFAHARLYYSLALAGTNAVSLNIWSRSLAEAREAEPSFTKTGQIWALVHISIAIGGIGSVAFGQNVVGFLTNGVLAPAARLIPWLFALLLIHLSGRAVLARVFAAGLGAQVTRMRAIFALATLAVLPLVIGKVGGLGLGLGVPGLIGALLVEALMYRLYLRIRAASIGPPPFQDHWAGAGVLGIAVVATLQVLIDPPIWVLWVGFSAAVVVVGVAAVSPGGPVRRLLASHMHAS